MTVICISLYLTAASISNSTHFISVGFSAPFFLSGWSWKFYSHLSPSADRDEQNMVVGTFRKENGADILWLEWQNDYFSKVEHLRDYFLKYIESACGTFIVHSCFSDFYWYCWWVLCWVEGGFHPHTSFQGFRIVPIQHQGKFKIFKKAWGRFYCHIWELERNECSREQLNKCLK